MMSTHLAIDESDLADDGPVGPAVPGERESLSPEKTLLAAMLQQALHEAAGMMGECGSPVNRARLRAEAELWILSRDTAWPFSFERVCEALRLDPDYIREHRHRVVRGGHLVHVRRRGRVEAG